MRFAVAISLAAGGARTLDAQAPEPSPAERATVARAAWGRASASQRAGLLDSAWADISRAYAAWSAQVAYAEAYARFAARRGDLFALERALRRLASQEIGGGLARDTAVTRVAAGSATASAALAALGRLRDADHRSRPRELLGDTAFFPEGIDADPVTGTLYVTSIRHRTVTAIARDGGVRSAIAAPRAASGAAPGAAPGAALGVAFDGARGALWVTTAKLPHMRSDGPGDTVRAELLHVRLADGAIVARWTLGDGTGTPGEIALSPGGDVLVSDGARGRLHRLRGGAGTLETIASPLLRSPQGIAPNGDGTVAWVADWSHGLLRWDLRTDAVTAVATPDDAALLGIDGLRRWGDRLIGVQNGVSPARIVGISLDEEGRVVRRVRTLDRPTMEGEPTVGVILGERYVYVSSSAWPFWTDQGERRPGTAPLPGVIVRELLLAR